MADRTKALLIAIATISLWYLNSFAFGYLSMERDTFGIYWPRREWLFAHVLGGMIALLVGPLQLWLGLNRRGTILHRVLGVLYVLAVFTSAGAAFYLARHTDFGWVFGMGMTAMSAAWLISTTFAAVSILRHMIDQHREWMIRSYVVTFAFVTFRLLFTILQSAHVGELREQLGASAWFCWAVPLLVTEAILQGRKVLGTRT